MTVSRAPKTASMSMRSSFSKIARHVSNALGTPYAFVAALVIVVVWACLGPFAGFSSTWQLVINTGTTIVTFLMVFLIQTSQNRDSKAVHLKLDELIYVISKARNRLIDCEDLTDEELNELDAEFQQKRTGTHPIAKVVHEERG